MKVKTVKIADLTLNPSNPRHNDDAVDHVAASLHRFGWQQPIVARPDGVVIAGNTRLKAAKSLGMTEVPVAYFDGDNLEATAYTIADNRTGEFATWDDPALAALLDELRNEDALEGVGYDEKAIDDLLAEVGGTFSPVDGDDQPRLDEKSKTTCPGCGHEF